MQVPRALRRSPRALIVAIVVLGCLLRVGYGVARYRDRLLRTGDEFVMLWDYDGLEHVLIARSLLDGHGYRVGPDVPGKTIRYGPHEALYKAPLYPYFLAAAFAVSGFNFALFFPLQAIAGGAAAGFVAAAALMLVRRRAVAAFSGIAAAAHPQLVNSASQPFNENVFVALMFAGLWAFLRWRETGDARWTVVAGALLGLTTLCRESAVPLIGVLALYAWAVPMPGGRRRSWLIASAMVLAALAVVLPWSLRTRMRTGAWVPVSSITGTAMSMGNNECLAREPLFSWYWADRPCLPLNEARAAALTTVAAERQSDPVIRNRINTRLAMAFVLDHPIDYARLSLQRAWTIYLPFHPRQQLGFVPKAAMAVYWLLVVPAGLVGLFAGLRRGPPFVLIALLTAAIIVPQVLVYISEDMRYRIPGDLLLAIAAGMLYVDLRQRGRADAPQGRVAI